MTVIRPAERMASAMSDTAFRYHLPLTEAQIRLMAGAAEGALFRLRKEGVRTLFPGPLTANQAQILQLAANGMGNAQIAGATFRTVHTIKTQLRRIYVRLGAHDRAHAVAIALARGLISLDDVHIPPGRAPGKPGRRPRVQAPQEPAGTGGPAVTDRESRRAG
ncbi:response regulator transcription factor [Streptomyces sp. NPDC058548]|uniref:response regulator transcription factor n=1 Tax=unclassified Streptomyces TaxID=2593676 RepID=UPI003669E06B